MWTGLVLGASGSSKRAAAPVRPGAKGGDRVFFSQPGTPKRARFGVHLVSRSFFRPTSSDENEVRVEAQQRGRTHSW